MVKKEIYLDDISFLKQVAGLHIKDYFVKITVLNWQEDPVQDIQGKVISANINIDGNSIVRRTATLSVYLDYTNNNITNAKNLLSINKKMNLQIGFINTTNKYTQFPFLWFPLGLFIITDNSISYSDSGLVASLQLKDKMCLLNGDCGGTLPASVIFDTYETIDENGNAVIERPTIYQIIQELVNHFGGEQLGKIIISDLDVRVKQVMKWTGTSPLYVYTKGAQYFYTIDPQGDQEYIKNKDNPLEDWPKQIFQYGEDIGYIYTDFTYPGELIGDAGNTITDILERIKEVLGNYEYFYDIDGNFVFREVKNYLNNAQSRYILDSINERQLVPDYINAYSDNPQAAYLIATNNGTSAFQFNDSNLISSYSNTPKYSEIKNDFVIWGIRKSAEGIQIPLRYHLAIDTKPTPGNTYQVFQYEDSIDGQLKWFYPITFASKDSFPQQGAAEVYYYDENSGNIYKWGLNQNQEYDYIKIDASLENITTKDWRTQLYFQGLVANVQGTESNYYFAQLFNEWPRIYDIRKGEFFKQTIDNPTQINFFLDFIDSPSAAISELDVNNIGRRTKVLNEGTNVNCVFEEWIPDLILINSDLDKDQVAKLRKECENRGQPYYQVGSAIYDTMQMGGIMYSAYEDIRQLIHEYTKYNQSISIQCLPIYHFEPNTRITVKNEESNIFGDYIIESLSFTLDNASVLNINATKAPEKI